MTTRYRATSVHAIGPWLALLVATILVTVPPRAMAQGDGGAKTIVVHIGQYTNDLHAATMGLSIAGILQQEGAAVTLFLDREAVRMADAGHPLLAYGDSDLETLMERFVAAGGRVMLCPHCAELGGVGVPELRDGVEMGAPKTIAALFIEADTVIDY
jgi:sulfur relay (sulfurtransferase) complex TusBCD TusD component (DsrE family)